MTWLVAIGAVLAVLTVFALAALLPHAVRPSPTIRIPEGGSETVIAPGDVFRAAKAANRKAVGPWWVWEKRKAGAIVSRVARGDLP